MPEYHLAAKPRTSPYAFRGLGEEALALLSEARAETNLPVVTEVMDARQLPALADSVDMLQIGARNMQNYTLLAAVGELGMPVVLKRGLSATIAELLLAAEYILAHGNPNIVLCERGIRTFETATRNTLDVSAIPVLQCETHLPVLVDPSHAGGRADLVEPLSRAAVVAGADGLLIEVHPDPSTALSDGRQSLSFEAFDHLMARLAPLARLCDRPLAMYGDAPLPPPRNVEHHGASVQPTLMTNGARRRSVPVIPLPGVVA
jgi:3-deoxy-7-phosphoheptulonate synthase